MNQRKLFLLVLSAVWLTLAALFALQNTQSQTPVHARTVNDYSIYIPFLVKNTGNYTPPTPTPPPGDSGPKAFFVDNQYRTNSASIQVDANGGMHLAYAYYQAANDGAPTYGVYFYCPSDCTNFDNWGGVGMGELVSEIQLALTPTGKPRIVYRSLGSHNSNDFYYAACDNDCTNPSQWSIAWTAMNQGTAILELHDDTLPQRYFALDLQGRPRFVYIDYNYQADPDHLGTFYAYCDSACNNTASWHEVRINQDNGNPLNYRYQKLYYPSLTFTPQGQPRIVADGVSLTDDFYLYYLACDSACGSTSNWHSVPLAARGSGPNVSYDIEVDGQGRPRVAYYQGAMLGGQGDRLSYLWCNNNCLNANNWRARDLGLGPNNGRGPDLELTANGQPRIAYAHYNVNGIGYSWCNANCESANGAWQHKVVESGTDLLAAWDVAFPPHCDNGFWNGLTPVLALDKIGNPHIAYDATYHARCWYNPVTGVWDPQPYFRLIWRVVRVNY